MAVEKCILTKILLTAMDLDAISHSPYSSAFLISCKLGCRLPLPERTTLASSHSSHSFEYPDDEVCLAQSIPPSVTVPKLDPYLYSASFTPTGAYSPLCGGFDTQERKALISKALLRAVRNGNLVKFREVLADLQPSEVQEYLHLRTSDNDTLLHVVCRSGNLPLCEELLSLGLNRSIDATNSAGETALHAACSSNQFAHVEMLINAGIQVNKPDKQGNTPLHSAILANNLEIAYFLRLRGAKSAIQWQPKRTIADLKRTTRGNERKSTAPVPHCTPLLSVPLPCDFQLLSSLGKGSFGQVFLVKALTSNKQYALKAIKKSTITARRLSKYAFTERNVLCRVNSPFIVKVFAAFQSCEDLFLLLEYCPGGDLGQYLAREKRFSEAKTRIYLCELVLALEELHQNHIIYRDLKPDNIVLAADGHLLLTDFGLAKEDIADNHAAQSFCGSMGYIAPEMIKKQGHGRAADWFMLGVLAYEFMTGTLPFYSRDRETLLRNMERGRPSYPARMSSAARSLIARVSPRQLLCKEPDMRLGAGGAEEIKSHQFFAGVDWEVVQGKGLKPPAPAHFTQFARPIGPDAPNLTLPSSGKGLLPGWEYVRGVGV
jgi:serine/threonine protein kinase